MDVSVIEDQLQRLALKLDEPFTPRGDPEEVCMLIGRRGRELHRATSGWRVVGTRLLRVHF
jgi:hypothetical protein